MSKKTKYKLGILSTHPIQYYVPWYRLLSSNPEIDLTVYFCYRQTPEGQSRAGYGISFEWDIPMLEGYNYIFLHNEASDPDVFNFFGCDTPEVKEIIKKGNFDAFIVSGWFNKSFWQAIISCWMTRTPLMVRGDSNLLSHGGSWLKRIIKYPIYNWFIPKFNAYLIVGQHSKEYYLNYGAKEEKMFFAPHSVDNTFFSEKYKSLVNKRIELRKSWGIPEDAIVFVLVGRLISRKLPHDFIYAIQKASKINPKIWGLIVGDGPLKKDIQQISKRSNIQMTFTGFLNQGKLPMAYTISDCLVNTSMSESWGLTVNEAMASNLPIIVSHTVGCMPDLVYDNETGFVYKCHDIQELSEKMITLASDTQKMKIMGEKAKNLIQNYSIEKTTEGTLKAVKSICIKADL